ncbi:D-Ala-D-Ala carboxypeptidase family metallohydrolase [uncultured Arthrobacter sp.]|uniref:D-Ala-D-Ala carboxypeptidase family metallohydrolase n=1 Tax=uncultured Arthrobacter sp. TaxID=114050 RepID=UPI00344B7BC4
MLLGEHPSLVVTSGRRSRVRNAQVGGALNSYHLRGRAIDVAGPLALLQAAAETAWRQRITRTCTGPEEVLIERAGRPGEHLHLAW